MDGADIDLNEAHFVPVYEELAKRRKKSCELCPLNDHHLLRHIERFHLSTCMIARKKALPFVIISFLLI